MNDPQPFDFAKLLIISGVVLLLAGSIMFAINKLGIGKMPGDLKFGDDNFRVYIPLGSCILISIVLTVIMWIIKMFGK